MEPAAVLVVPFEVQVSLRARRTGATVNVFVAGTGVGAFEHRGVGGAGVKPDLQDIGAFGVVLGILRADLGEDGVRAGHAPGLDTTGFNHVGRQIKNLHGQGMQLATVFVQEKGQRHAPTALARDAPVGPAGDHVAQAGLAVFGVERGLLNRVQRSLTQGFGGLVFGEYALALVHANEPLGRSAVNHGGLVAPAVRVAVGDVLGGHQATGIAQRLDDDRARLPDVLSAKQRQLGLIRAVALHRVQNVVIGHAMRHAGVEILDAIGGRGMDQTGAIVGRGVVGQVDRAQTVVARIHMRQRVLEVQATQVFAQGGGEHGAGQLVAHHALFDQALGQHQQATLSVNQSVDQLRIQVERLVGGNGPRGGGPDHCKGVFGQRLQAKGSGQLGGLCAQERNVQRL